MALIELLINGVGMSISKSLLHTWLKDNEILESASTALLDIIKSKTNNFLAARKTAREFEIIAEKVGTSLAPLFESYNLKDVSKEAVALEVSNSIIQTKITAKLMATLNYDNLRLSEQILKVNEGKDKDFSENEKALYKRSISLASQYLIDIAPQLPQYNLQNFTEILERIDRLMQAVHRVTDDLYNVITLDNIKNEDRKYAEFESDYRASIMRKFDRINLFGSGLTTKIRRYQLTVAYVSLEVNITDKYGKNYESRISVEEALSSERYMAIIGEAGTGKTTLLQWLAVNSASENLQSYIPNWGRTIPFMIELRRVKDNLPTPEEFIKQTTPEIYNKLPKNWITHILESGTALLLVDGLDEVSSLTRLKVIDWLEDLIRTYNIRVVFTSRPGAKEWNDLVETLEFKQINTTLMSFDRIQMFIQHWHKAVLGDQEVESIEYIDTLSQKLIYKIQNNSSLMRLSTNPLLCAMLCALHYEKNMQLPSDRSELYEACCAMLLERRDSEREIEMDLHLSYRQKRALLDDLAYWMLKNGNTSVVISEAADHINPHLRNMSEELHNKSAEKVLYSLIERSGIIREPNQGEVDFIHRTFQEYMAASAANNEVDWGSLVNYAKDDQWHETIKLAAGFANPKYAKKLLEDLLQKSKDSCGTSYKYDLLAMACLETIIEVPKEIREKIKLRIADLIPPKNQEQCRALAATGDLAVPFLSYHKEYSEAENLYCINTLGMITSRTALTQISTYLANDISLKIFDAIKKILLIITPKEVYASNIYLSLLNYIKKLKHGNELILDDIIIYSLSKVPTEILKKILSFNIDRLKIIGFKERSLNIMSSFIDLGKLTELTIDGDVSNFDGLKKFKKLSVLNLKNNTKYWPELSQLKNLKNLHTIKIATKKDSWPDFSQMKTIVGLKKICIFSDGGPEIYRDTFNDISDLREIEYIHIASTQMFDFDISPLAELYNLQIIEISTFSLNLPTNIFYLSDIKNLNKIIVNIDIADYNLEKFIKNVTICVPDCIVEYNTNWNCNEW